MNLTVWLGGLETGGQLLELYKGPRRHLTIERERWLAVLQQLEAGTR